MNELTNVQDIRGIFNNHFENFKKSVEKVTYQKNLTKLTFEQLEAFEKELENHGIIVKTDSSNVGRISGVVGTSFIDLQSKRLIEVNCKEYTYLDVLSGRNEIKNQQYQFLLLQAFESFESYLKNINKSYRLGGERDGATKISKIIINTNPWFKDVINNNCPSNSDYLTLDIAIAEQLRHNIAHTFGYRNNKDHFIKKCLERIGCYQNGKPKAEYSNNINYYFGSRHYENLICLVEVYDKNVNSFNALYHE